MNLVQTLIARLKEIELAFRRGHSLFRPRVATSLRASEKARAISRSDMHYEGEDDVIDHLCGHQSDSVEELANSTDSLHFTARCPRRELVSLRQSIARDGLREDDASPSKENFQSHTVSSSNTPYNDKLKSTSKRHNVVGRLSISSYRSHSSLRTSAALLQVVTVPTTPVQQRQRRSASPFSHCSYSSSPRSSRNEEEYHQQAWDSPLSTTSSQQSSQWQPSLVSSPATSVDTRSSISSQYSPKSILHDYTHLSTRKRKDVALKLEAESLQAAISTQLSLDPALLDSPTDPDTETATSVFLHPGSDFGLGFNFVETRPKLVPFQPNARSPSYDSQVGVAL